MITPTLAVDNSCQKRYGCRGVGPNSHREAKRSLDVIGDAGKYVSTVTYVVIVVSDLGSTLSPRGGCGASLLLSGFGQVQRRLHTTIEPLGLMHGPSIPK